jgi:hypothetical protein
VKLQRLYEHRVEKYYFLSLLISAVVEKPSSSGIEITSPPLAFTIS